jgi:hypothetical protein
MQKIRRKFKKNGNETLIRTQTGKKAQGNKGRI